MNLSGPSSAKVGQSVTVTASGLPEGTTGVKFSAGPNLGLKSGSGSVSWSFKPDFQGDLTVSAIAQNEFGSPLGSASKSIQVSDPSFDFQAEGSSGFAARSSGSQAGQLPIVIEQIPPLAHSILIEFFGDIGGIYRYFPRGRERMEMRFQTPSSGRGNAYITLRDQNLQTLAVQMVPLDLGQTAAQVATGLAPAPVMDLMKPPFIAEAGVGPSSAGTSSNLADRLQQGLEDRILNRLDRRD